LKYIGSKNKISKELAPIIQSYITKDTKGYLEPFVGGANMIDKIQCNKKIGSDIHEELIELLEYVQNFSGLLPKTISEDTYKEVKNNKDKYEKWYVGLVGFCATFSGKYFGGYARSFKSDGVTLRDMPNECIRNLQKQAPNLEGIEFKNANFLALPKDRIKGYVVYCDIPYRDTTKYKTEKFPYEEFYKWCKEMSVYNTVLISEYNMPEEFECIWQKETKVNFDSNRTSNDEKNIRVEKLFTYNKLK
jgi:site-specific DNA-adenine methylase